ncbi:unnamed protein product [Brassica oleracea]
MCCGKRRYTAIKDAGEMETGLFFLLGFVFPPLWYYATFLYFGNYYRRDPRERGLWS